MRKIVQNLFRSLDPPSPPSGAPRNCVDTPIFLYPRGRVLASSETVNCQAGKRIDVNAQKTNTKRDQNVARERHCYHSNSLVTAEETR